MKHKKQELGFTLIEAMVVVFIIGLFSFVAAVGYGKANRQKILDQAGRKVSSELDRTRSYSIFGQKVEGKYPCGYGISVKKSGSEIKRVYTSSVNADRLNVIETDKTCDELIKSGIEIAEENVDGDDNSLGKVVVEEIVDKLSARFNCLTVLFSAPRGVPYFCASTSASCSPASCATFQVFPEENFFINTFKIEEGNNLDRAQVKIFPNGNTEVTYD